MDDIINPIDGRRDAFDILCGNIHRPLMQRCDGILRRPMTHWQASSLRVYQGASGKLKEPGTAVGDGVELLGCFVHDLIGKGIHQIGFDEPVIVRINTRGPKVM